MNGSGTTPWALDLGLHPDEISLAYGSAPPADVAHAFVDAVDLAPPAAEEALAALANQPFFADESSPEGIVARWWQPDRQALVLEGSLRVLRTSGSVVDLGDGRLGVGWAGRPGRLLVATKGGLVVLSVERGRVGFQALPAKAASWVAKPAPPPELASLAPALPELGALMGENAKLPDAAAAEFEAWARGGTVFDAAVALGVAVRHVVPAGTSWSAGRLPATGDVVRTWARNLPLADVERLEREACVLAGNLAGQLDALDDVEDDTARDLLAGVVRQRDALASCHQTLAAAGRAGRLRESLRALDDAALAQIDRVLRLVPDDDFTQAVAEVDADAWWGLRAWK
jgi:hypothetical protein